MEIDPKYDKQIILLSKNTQITTVDMFIPYIFIYQLLLEQLIVYQDQLLHFYHNPLGKLQYSTYFSEQQSRKSNSMLYQQIVKNGHQPAQQQSIVERMFKITQQELIDQVTGLVSIIKDPQYSVTLSQLDIIRPNSITISYLPTPPISNPPPSSHTRTQNPIIILTVQIKPTVPHCHLTQQIGLSIRLKLQQELPSQWTKKLKIRIRIQEGTHNDREEMEKLMNDRERIAAAMDNQEVMGFIRTLIQ